VDLSDVRARFPQYDNLTDKQLADALHAKFYADIPKADFYERIGLTKPKSGFGAAFKASVESLKGEAALLGGKLGLMSEKEAQRYQAEQEDIARGIFRPTKEGWLEAPGTKFGELLGGSLPYMAAPVAAGAAAIPLGAAAPIAATAGAGLASLAQFTGTNLARQLEAQKERGEEVSLERASGAAATAAAVPQAALDMVSLKALPLVRNLFKSVGKDLTEAEAKRIAEQGFKQTVADYAKTGARVAGIEGLTEAGQQYFERLQAGLSIADADAREEYIDSFVGGAVLGAGLSPVGRFVERGGEQGRAQKKLGEVADEQRKAEREAQAKLEAEEAEKRKQPEYLTKLQADYQAAKAKDNAYKAEIKALDAQKDDPAALARAKELRAEHNNFQKTELSEIVKDYNKAGGAKFFKQFAEQQRVAGMTPLEYQMEQLGVKFPEQPPEQPRVFTGEGFEPAAKRDAVAEYATTQLDLARQQDMGTFTEADYAQYLMQDPDMAKQLVAANAQLPGFNKKQSTAILGGMKLQLQQQAKESYAGATDLLKAQRTEPQQLFLDQWQQDQEALDAERKESVFDTKLTELVNTALQGTPTVEAPEGATVDRRGAVFLQRLDEAIAQRDAAAKAAEQAFAAGNREAGAAKSKERENAQLVLNQIEQQGGNASLISSLRKEQDSALMDAAGLIDDLRSGITLGDKEQKGAASSTAETLRAQIDKARARYIDAAVKEAAATQRIFGKALSQDDALKAALQMQQVFDEWVTRSAAKPRKDVEEVRVKSPAQMRGTKIVKGAELETYDPRPLEERRFGAQKAAIEVLQEQLRQISSRLSAVPEEGRRAESLLRPQYAITEAQKTAEARGETAETLGGELRRRREYVGNLIDRALQTREGLPDDVVQGLERARDAIDAGRGGRDVLTAVSPEGRAGPAPFAAGLLDAAEQLAQRALSGRMTTVTGGVQGAREQKGYDALAFRRDEINRQYQDQQRQLTSGVDENGKELTPAKKRKAQTLLATYETQLENLNKRLAGPRPTVEPVRMGTGATTGEDAKLLREIDDALRLTTPEEGAPKQGELFAEKELPATAFARATARNFENSPPVKKARAAVERGKKLLADVKTAWDAKDAQDKAQREQKVGETQEAIAKQREVYRETFQAALKKAQVAEIVDRFQKEITAALQSLQAVSKERAAAVAAGDMDAVRLIDVIRDEERGALLQLQSDLAKALEKPSQNIEPAKTTGMRGFVLSSEIQAAADEWVTFERDRLTKLEGKLQRLQGADRKEAAKEVVAQRNAVQEATISTGRAMSGLGLPGVRVQAGRVVPIKTASELAAEERERRDEARKSAEAKAAATAEREQGLEGRILEIGNEVAEKKAAVDRARTDATKERLNAEITKLEREASLLEAQLGTPELSRTEKRKARKAQKTGFTGKGVGSEKELLGTVSEKLRDLESDVRKRLLSEGLLRSPEQVTALASQQLTPYERRVLEGRFKKQETATQRTKRLQGAFEAMAAEKKGAERIEGMYEGVEGVLDSVRIGDKDIFFSRGATPNPSTAEGVRTELGKVFPNLGRIQIYDSVDALIAANPEYEGRIPSDARGFVDPSGNKAFLIAENIDKGRALGVLLHEVGAHIGLRNMLGEAQYNALVKAVESWEKRNDGSTESRVAQAARRRVEAADTPASQVNDELLAYAIEEAVNAGVKPFETKGVIGQWLSRIASLFQKALQKFGLAPKEMTAAELVDMAFGAAGLEMRGAGAKATGRGKEKLLFTYAGEKAGVAKEALQKAKDMLIKGAPLEKVWNETGWFQGPDKKWRYELDDSKADFSGLDRVFNAGMQAGQKEVNTTLGEVMDHPDLYAAYPDIKNFQVTLYDDPQDNVYGSVSDKRMRVNIGKPDIEGTLVHEVQHLIQDREGFGKGGSATGQYMRGYTTKMLESVRASYARQLDEATDDFDRRYYGDRVAAMDAAVAASSKVRGEVAQKIREARAKYTDLSQQYAAFKAAEEAERDAAQKEYDALNKDIDQLYEEIKRLNAVNVLDPQIRILRNQQDELRKKANAAFDKSLGFSFAKGRDFVKAIGKARSEVFDTKLNYKKEVEAAVDKAIADVVGKDALLAKFAKLTISDYAYQNLLGEVEARDVGERRTLTEEVRRETRPYSSQPQRAEEILFSRAPQYNDSLSDAGLTADKMISQRPGVYAQFKQSMLGMGFRTRFLDALAPLEKVSGMLGDAVKGMQMMYYLRMYGMRMNFTSLALSDGVPQLVEKKRRDGGTEWVIESVPGVNIKQIVERLSRKDVIQAAGSADAANRLFTLYLAKLRADNKGYDKLNFGRASAEAELKEIEAELASGKLSADDKTRVKQRQEHLLKVRDSLPTEADIKKAFAEIEADPVLSKAFADARSMYNEFNQNLLRFMVQTGAMSKDEADRLLREKDYVPYYRVRNGVAELMIGGLTPVRIGNLKDSPHLQELMGGEEPIFNFLDSSVQNTSMLVDMAMRNIAVKNAMWEMASVGLAKIRKAGRAGAPKNAVEFKKDGEDWYAVVDTEHIGIPSELLTKGLAGIPTMFPQAIEIMGMPARFLRRAITASPVYAGRQLFRDSLSSYMASGSNAPPVLGALQQIGKASSVDRRGITGGQVFTGTSEDKARLLREMQEGRPGWSKLFSKLEAMSMEADAATRRSQYQSYLDQGLSEMEATFMALESMNFARRGIDPSVQLLTTLIPFMNAQIQSLDVLYRSLRGQMPMNERLQIKEKLIARGTMLASMSMIYALSMQDDETYKNARPDEKYNNWFVPIPGMDEKLRVPIPFELGYIFKALPEAVINGLFAERGADEALDAAKGILRNMIPGGGNYGIPAAVKPLIEVGLGKSFFTGRDLESGAEQMQEPWARYRENTSEAAKILGQLFNISPIKIETLVSGYTGSLGMALMQAANVILPTPETDLPEKRISQLPVVGTLFQPKDAASIIDDTFDRLKDYTAAKETYEGLVEKGELAKADAYLRNNIEKIQLASISGAYKQQIGAITKAERQVRGSSLTSQEKRDLLDDLRQAKILVASSVRDSLGRIEAR